MSGVGCIVDGPVATVEIDRSSSRGGTAQAIWPEITSTFRRLGADRNVRAIVLAGINGAQHGIHQSTEAVKDREFAIESSCDAIAGVSQPVIAIVTDNCFNGVCRLSTACDFRFAGPYASFEISAANHSVVYGARSTRRLLSLVGASNAKRILYGAERLGVLEAARMGLVDRLSDDPSGDAQLFALELARKAPLSISGAKYILNDASMADGGLLGPVIVDRASDSEDYREGRQAFAEKRLPNFKWR